MNVKTDLQALQQIFPSTAPEKAGAATRGAGTPQVAAGSDEATLSTAASLAAQAAPDSDVRMEKVAQVQQAIAAGTYHVPSSQVADRMIDSLLRKG